MELANLSTLKAGLCKNGCSSFGPLHRHCDLCRAYVAVEQAGPGCNDLDIDEAEGIGCHGEVVCADCVTAVDDQKMCRACADSVAIDEATASIEQSFANLTAALGNPTARGWSASSVQLLELSHDLETWTQKIKDIKAELPGKIHFATYGKAS